MVRCCAAGQRGAQQGAEQSAHHLPALQQHGCGQRALDMDCSELGTAVNELN